MNELDDVSVARLDGRGVSLGEVLRLLRADGNLGFLRDALTKIVIVEAARAAGLAASDAELQEALRVFRRERALQSAEATNRWLAQEAMTLEDLEERLEREILTQKLKAQITEGEEESYFAQHRLNFESATIAQIRVAEEGLAREIKAQIDDEEEDFAVLARRHSLDASAAAGGYLGSVARRSLGPAVEAAVFGAPPGAVVGPVETRGGYLVLKVENREDGRLDAATKADIRELLFARYVAEEVERAQIEWMLFGPG